MTEHPASRAEFDAYAAEYDAALQEGLKLTGAGKEHYAEQRALLLRDRLRAAGITTVGRLLDFGCGDGDAAPVLREVLGAREVVGVDVSEAMLSRARARHGWARFATIAELPQLGSFDVAHCNGVFHHIPRSDRLEAAQHVWRALTPGGVWGYWENHPWNPGTRMVMARVSFDRDADMLSPPQSRALLRRAGFAVERTDHLFILPIGSALVRRLERWVSRLPIGGQYLVLARKPRA
jgi:SAM-dependent methyltransferase